MPVLRRSEDIQAHRALGLAALRSSSLAARPSNADDARELGGDEAVEKAVRSTMEAWRIEDGERASTWRLGGAQRKRKAKWPFPAYMAVRPSQYGAAGDFLALLVAF